MTTPTASEPSPAPPAAPGRRLGAVLDRLDNSCYLPQAVTRAPYLATLYFNAPRSEIIWAVPLLPYPTLPGLLTDAIAAGRITADDACDIALADIVLLDTAGGYYLVQASITLNDGHITRARRRADLLAQAMRSPVLPFVIGTQIPDAVRATAAAHNVAVCIEPDKYDKYG